MVSLERNPSYINHDIPLDADKYYRGVAVESYEDLWESTEDGREIMKGYGKGGSDRLSFQAGYPNDLYINGIVKSNMIIEGDASMPIDHQEERSGYTFVTELDRAKVESGEIPLRVWMRRKVGGEAIELVHVWDKVFDSFPSDREN